jgi:hypothetical protein
MSDRWLGWWRVARMAGASLTEPRVDRARVDAVVWNAAVRSRLFARGAAGVAAARKVWLGSHTATRLCQLRRAIPTVPVDRVRFVARSAAVAAITVLVLLPFGTSSGRGFQAIVPIAVLLAAVAADRCAGVLARASLDGRA